MNIIEYCHHQNYWTEVDNYFPLYEERLFKETKNALILPVSKFYGIKDSFILDNFVLTSKRCYNSNEIRSHICRYLNYFTKFYDKEYELIFYMCRIKTLIDMGKKLENGTQVNYTMQEFLADISKYILSSSMYNKVWKMVEDNYKLELNYKNKANEALQYCDRHGKYLMEICIFQNILIPLMMHFVYKNKILNMELVNELIFTVYNWLIDMYKDPIRMEKRGLQPADIYAKLYETAITTMNSHYKTNKTLWDMSGIRGFCPTINANDSVNTLIMQVMPKYTFKGNVVTYNITSVRNNIKYNISDISFEYDFISLSSSKRDGEDNTSQFDKFEAHLQKTDESLALQNDFRAQITMANIMHYCTFIEDEEIQFYRKILTKNGEFLVNKFQQNLVNNMFYRYFGDTVSINSINGDQYISLIVIAKKLLIADKMRILPHIISSHVIKISTRTSLCKKEALKITNSDYYTDLLNKYSGNEKIMKQIMSLIATTLSSTFKVIDYDEENHKAGPLNGKEIIMDNDILIDEMLRFILKI